MPHFAFAKTGSPHPHSTNFTDAPFIAPDATRVRSARVVTDLMAAAMVALVGISVWSMSVWINSTRSVDPIGTVHSGSLTIGCLAIFSLFLLAVRKRLSLSLSPRQTAFITVAAGLAAAIAAFVAMSASITAESVTTSVLLAGTAGLAAATARLTLCSLVQRAPFNGHARRRVAVYGASQDSARIFNSLAKQRDDIELIGLYENRQERDRTHSVGIPVTGNLEELEAMARAGIVDEVIIAMPHWAKDRIRMIATQLEQYPVDVHLPAESVKDLPCVDRQFYVSKFGEIRLVRVQSTPLRDWSLVAKFLQDRILGVVFLIILSPLLAAITVAIKLDSHGPTIFRQRRHGLCGREIVVWKFRTMQVMEDGATVTQAQKQDPRITRVGKFLRKTSLDELPQLINVVRGEMSIVGPRPHAIAHNEHYAKFITAYNGRNQMKPGITGWAQINGYRGETRELSQMEKRIEYDLWYIQNWSSLLDLKVILLTPFYGLIHKNAY